MPRERRSKYANDAKDTVGIASQVESLSSSLAQKANQLLLRNAKQPLDLPTYERKNQGCHPKVLYIANGWNGYKWWMAFTPFGDSNDLHENPSILASNDGIKWVVPTGLTNPIATAPSAERFYSDTHILINSANEMECWYRQMYKDLEPEQELIWRQKSTDGVTWSVPELLRQVDSPDRREILSPAVFWDSSINKYSIWVVSREPLGLGKNIIKYYESATGNNWEYIRTLNVPAFEAGLWHLDVEKTELGYEFIAPSQFSDGSMNLYYFTSTDNITTTKPVILIAHGEKGSFDEYQIYRSSLTKVNGKYYIYYSASDGSSPRKWGIALSVSTNLNDIFSIVGFNYNTNTMSKDANIVKEFPTIITKGIEKLGDFGYLLQDKIKLIITNGAHFIARPATVRGISGMEIVDVNNNPLNIKAKTIDATTTVYAGNSVESPNIVTSAVDATTHVKAPLLQSGNTMIDTTNVKLVTSGVATSYFGAGNVNGEFVASSNNAKAGDGAFVANKYRFTSNSDVCSLSKETGITGERPDSLLVYSSGAWRKVILANYFTTAERPSAPFNGYQYFDTTKNKLVIRHNGQWVDALGTVVG
jgi:hypothetical protein